MKILIISTKLPYPPKDGGAIATLNMATGMADTGNEVVMLSMNTPKHFFPPDDIPGSLRDKITFHAVPVDTRIHRAKFLANLLFSGLPYNATRFHSDDFLSELKRLLSATRFDIIQMEGPYLDHYLPAIRQYSGARIAFRSHNLEHEIWSGRAKSTRNPFIRYYLSVLSRRIRRLEKKLLDEVDFLVPISGKDLEGFRQMGLNIPFLICPTGLNLKEYTGMDQTGEFSLFFIGALDWGPNTEGLDWFFLPAI